MCNILPILGKHIAQVNREIYLWHRSVQYIACFADLELGGVFGDADKEVFLFLVDFLENVL